MIVNPNLAFIASSKILAIYDEGNKVNIVFDLKLGVMRKPNIDDLLELEYNEFGAFYIQSVFFRKSIVDNANGFDEYMVGDDIILRTKIFRYIRYIKEYSAYTFEIVRESICYYNRYEGNISNNSIRQIKIVTECLQCYWLDREYLDILVARMFYTIEESIFSEFLNVFTMNAKVVSLLKNEEIQKRLKK